MPVLTEPRPGTLLPVRVAELPDTSTTAHNWRDWLTANDAGDAFPGPWVLDITGNTVTQDPRHYGPAGALALVIRQAPSINMLHNLAFRGALTCTAEDASAQPGTDGPPCCIVLVDYRGRHPGPHTDGAAQWENSYPYLEDSPVRPRRRAGVLVIPESDLTNLARLQPGQRITGLKTDHMRQAVLLRVEGAGLPEVDELSELPYVDTLRYRPPPLVERVDVEHLPPAQQHATVLQVLGDLLEHAGHLGAANHVRPDMSVSAHATWIGADEIVRRHAPDLDRSTHRLLCTHCESGPGAEGAYWPCPDYRAAAQGAVTGLTDPEGITP